MPVTETVIPATRGAGAITTKSDKVLIANRIYEASFQALGLAVLDSRYGQAPPEQLALIRAAAILEEVALAVDDYFDPDILAQRVADLTRLTPDHNETPREAIRRVLGYDDKDKDNA